MTSSDYVVAFTGAGISTGSGLPDYRGPRGIWTLRDMGQTPVLPKKPWFSYDPNPGHLALAKMMSQDHIHFVISQNVDGLHIKSGIPRSKIAELHGNSTLMKCEYCESIFTLTDLGWERSIHGKGSARDKIALNQPVCLNCGGRVVSTVVDFGDPLPREELGVARSQSIRSDLFLVLGSSLSVHPAASLPRTAKKNGAKIVIINQGDTRADDLADLKINDDLSLILPKIADMLD